MRKKKVNKKEDNSKNNVPPLDVGDDEPWDGTQERTFDREIQDYENSCGRDG